MKKTYYFPPVLQTEIKNALHFPLSLLEADSGCGKTSLVTEYLLKQTAGSYRFHYYTCLGESAEKAWSCICSVFSRIDPLTGKHLAAPGTPFLDALPDIAVQMQKLQCSEPTLIILDNHVLPAASFFSLLRILTVFFRRLP